MSRSCIGYDTNCGLCFVARPDPVRDPVGDPFRRAHRAHQRSLNLFSPRVEKFCKILSIVARQIGVIVTQREVHELRIRIDCFDASNIHGVINRYLDCLDGRICAQSCLTSERTADLGIC